jgi:hypothetical protein
MKIALTVETEFSKDRREAIARLDVERGWRSGTTHIHATLPDGTEEDAIRLVLIAFAGGKIPNELAAGKFTSFD